MLKTSWPVLNLGGTFWGNFRVLYGTGGGFAGFKPGGGELREIEDSSGDLLTAGRRGCALGHVSDSEGRL
jgi:hypothetical protein